MHFSQIRAAATVTALTAWAALQCLAQPLSTAFTYQGSVSNAGQPASGLHDFRFRLYDAPVGGNQVGATLCTDNVAVTGGSFTVSMDFGAQFAGQARYLEIEVRQDTGLSCGNLTGFTVLSPRQQLTATPNASFSLNAASLGGQPGSFYLNASNLGSGTIPDARLAATIPRTTAAQTFSGANTFSNAANIFTGSFSGSGAGLGSLNAGSVTGGTLADARLSSNIPRLNAANVFSAVNTFSSSTIFSGVGIGTTPAFPLDISTGVQTTVNIVGSNTGGTWFNLRNTTGRTWNLISSGAANGEGPGKLLVRDANAGAVRMTFDTAGNVGVGTTSPAAPLDLALGDKRMQFRFDSGLVPGINLTGSGGNLGIMRLRNSLEIWPNDAGTAAGQLSVWDAAGNPTIALDGSTGRVGAKNMPVLNAFQLNRDARNTTTWDPIGAGQNRDMANLTVNVPSGGFLYITAWININTFGIDEAAPCIAYLKLSESTGGNNVQLTEVAGSFDSATSSPIATYEMSQVVSLTWVVPTGPGSRSFVTNVFTPNMGVRVGSRALSVLYFPGSM